ncbi:MAG: hypothetical protein DMG68_19660 [Acidobacteria bacterium]|nr:MAG: hypothetical protein DMG68_19660 [Acidobacteriota bacterium]
MKKPLRWLASLLHLRRQARFVTWILPNRYWYRAALAMCRLQAALSGALGGNRVLTEAVMLDNWLWELTTIGPFPIPWTLNGLEVIEATDRKIGTVFCWIHEPLVEFPMRPFLETVNTEAIVVADRGRIVDGGLVAGLERRLVAIPADRYALGRAKRSLQEGTSVVCLADATLGGSLQPFVLQVAGRVGARVVFQWAKRRPDGTIEVTFIDAPRPHCETSEAVHENLAFLRAAQQRALAALGLPDQQSRS